MQDELRSLVQTPPPRPAEVVATYLGQATRGYRLFGGLMWGCALFIALLMGLISTDGEKLSTFIFALSFGAVLFAIPSQIFVTVNLRTIRTSLVHGHRVEADVVTVRQRWRGGQKVPEIELAFREPRSDRERRAVVSGLPPTVAPGTIVEALYAPRRPTKLALFWPGLGLIIGRVR